MHRYSALENHYTVGEYSSSETKLSLKEIKKLEITQIVCWPDKIKEISNQFLNQLNISEIPGFNRGIIFKNSTLWRMEPLKWWLIDNKIKISEDVATTLDISHAFTGIEIKGNDSKLFLNRHLPIDLRAKNFPEMSSSNSAIHHVSVKLFKLSSNKFYLYIPRGFALSIWDLLLETADQFGYEILNI